MSVAHSIRIVTCIDVPADNPADAYRMLRAFFKAIPESWGYETSDEWFHSDGQELSQVEIDCARSTVLRESEEA